jgi:hypothetical protein
MAEVPDPSGRERARKSVTVSQQYIRISANFLCAFVSNNNREKRCVSLNMTLSQCIQNGLYAEQQCRCYRISRNTMATNSLMHDRICIGECIKLHYIYYARSHHLHNHPLVKASNIFLVGSTASQKTAVCY